MRERLFVPTDCEVRAAGDGKHVLTAYAMVYERLSQNLGGFVEQIAPGAASKSIADDDIRGLRNHDANLLLGRTRSGTLRLASDDQGVHYEIDLPNTTVGRDTAEMVARGDMTGSSFAFTLVGEGADEWGATEQDFPLRTIKRMKLYDVGPVTYPAYEATNDTDFAAALRSLAGQTGRPVEDLVAAAGRNELRSLMTPVDDEPTKGQGETHPSGLAVARARALELLESA